jgi:nicotinamide-nucleotide amidase
MSAASATAISCEVVAVGTELLLGQIVDTNSSWIGAELAQIGIDSHFQTKVGDNSKRMLEVIDRALQRSDAVVICGGLGPTQDDITREVVALALGVELERREDLVDKIGAMFGVRGRDMPANNLRQADVPVGAEPIPVQPGTAPGLVCPSGDKVIYAVPGVPWEMQAMMTEFVLPDLAQRAGITSIIRSRTLRTWGTSESRLAEMLGDEIDRLDGVGGATIAFLASGWEGLKVRITAKAESDGEVEAILAAEEEVVRGIIGDIVFGVDEETMESVVLELCRQAGLTFGVAESLTGGLIGARVTDTAGCSDVFKGSIVSYAPEVKFSVLGVPEGPVVSEQAAAAMAAGACEVLDCDVSVAVTGVAGPEALEGKDPGTVCIATRVDGITETLEISYPFDRERTRQFTVITTLDLLRRRLLSR